MAKKVTKKKAKKKNVFTKGQLVTFIAKPVAELFKLRKLQGMYMDMSTLEKEGKTVTGIVLRDGNTVQDQNGSRYHRSDSWNVKWMKEYTITGKTKEVNLPKKIGCRKTATVYPDGSLLIENENISQKTVEFLNKESQKAIKVTKKVTKKKK